MFLVSNYELNNKHSLKGKLIMVKFLQQLLNLSHLIKYQVNYDFAKLLIINSPCRKQQHSYREGVINTLESSTTTSYYVFVREQQSSSWAYYKYVICITKNWMYQVYQVLVQMLNNQTCDENVNQGWPGYPADGHYQWTIKCANVNTVKQPLLYSITLRNWNLGENPSIPDIWISIHRAL